MSKKKTGKLPVRFTGQHFLKDNSVIKDIIKCGNINSGDLILDIGAGKGALTFPLAKRSHKVIAIEKDPELAQNLINQTKEHKHIKVLQKDFRHIPLPSKPYKVISNIPYSITTDIFGRLMDMPDANMKGGVIVMEHGTAIRFIAKEQTDPRIVGWNTLFDLSIIRKIHPRAFSPAPKVYSAMLSVKRVKRPDSIEKNYSRYMAFVCSLLATPDAAAKTVLKSIFSYNQLKRILEDCNISHYTTLKNLTINQWIYCYSMLQRFIPERVHPAMPGKYKKLYSGK